jgi:hypothetical protein
MRDYNSIQFRSPKQKQQQQQQQQPRQQTKRVTEHPLVDPLDHDDDDDDPQDEQQHQPQDKIKRESRQGSTSTVPSTATSTSFDHHHSMMIIKGGGSQQQQHESSLPPNTNTNTDHSLSASDALAMRRDGAEATIQRLRTALDDVTSQDHTAKSSLAKSDAIILELRSLVRQLKRQLDKIQFEKDTAQHEQEATLLQLKQQQEESTSNKAYATVDPNNATSNWDTQTAQTAESARDARVGELQVQLDRAHAQILTADMVRKELEDTLEAEQYTWELRVQEQERTIREWQDQCQTLQHDLEECRNQWKDAEEGWTKEVQQLQNRSEKHNRKRHIGRVCKQQRPVIIITARLLVVTR